MCSTCSSLDKRAMVVNDLIRNHHELVVSFIAEREALSSIRDSEAQLRKKNDYLYAECRKITEDYKRALENLEPLKKKIECLNKELLAKGEKLEQLDRDLSLARAVATSGDSVNDSRIKELEFKLAKYESKASRERLMRRRYTFPMKRLLKLKGTFNNSEAVELIEMLGECLSIDLTETEKSALELERRLATDQETNCAQTADQSRLRQAAEASTQTSFEASDKCVQSSLAQTTNSYVQTEISFSNPSNNKDPIVDAFAFAPLADDSGLAEKLERSTEYSQKHVSLASDDLPTINSNWTNFELEASLPGWEERQVAELIDRLCQDVIFSEDAGNVAKSKQHELPSSLAKEAIVAPSLNDSQDSAVCPDSSATVGASDNPAKMSIARKTQMTQTYFVLCKCDAHNCVGEMNTPKDCLPGVITENQSVYQNLSCVTPTPENTIVSETANSSGRTDINQDSFLKSAIKANGVFSKSHISSPANCRNTKHVRFDSSCQFSRDSSIREIALRDSQKKSAVLLNRTDSDERLCEEIQKIMMEMCYPYDQNSNFIPRLSPIQSPVSDILLDVNIDEQGSIDGSASGPVPVRSSTTACLERAGRHEDAGHRQSSRPSGDCSARSCAIKRNAAGEYCSSASSYQKTSSGYGCETDCSQTSDHLRADISYIPQNGMTTFEFRIPSKGASRISIDFDQATKQVQFTCSTPSVGDSSRLVRRDSPRKALSSCAKHEYGSSLPKTGNSDVLCNTALIDSDFCNELNVPGNRFVPHGLKCNGATVTNVYPFNNNKRSSEGCKSQLKSSEFPEALEETAGMNGVCLLPNHDRLAAEVEPFVSPLGDRVTKLDNVCCSSKCRVPSATVIHTPQLDVKEPECKKLPSQNSFNEPACMVYRTERLSKRSVEMRDSTAYKKKKDRCQHRPLAKCVLSQEEKAASVQKNCEKVESVVVEASHNKSDGRDASVWNNGGGVTVGRDVVTSLHGHSSASCSNKNSTVYARTHTPSNLFAENGELGNLPVTRASAGTNVAITFDVENKVCEHKLEDEITISNLEVVAVKERNSELSISDTSIGFQKSQNLLQSEKLKGLASTGLLCSPGLESIADRHDDPEHNTLMLDWGKTSCVSDENKNKASFSASMSWHLRDLSGRLFVPSKDTKMSDDSDSGDGMRIDDESCFSFVSPSSPDQVRVSNHAVAKVIPLEFDQELLQRAYAGTHDQKPSAEADCSPLASLDGMTTTVATMRTGIDQQMITSQQTDLYKVREHENLKKIAGYFKQNHTRFPSIEKLLKNVAENYLVDSGELCNILQEKHLRNIFISVVYVLLHFSEELADRDDQALKYERNIARFVCTKIPPMNCSQAPEKTSAVVCCIRFIRGYLMSAGVTLEVTRLTSLLKLIGILVHQNPAERHHLMSETYYFIANRPREAPYVIGCFLSVSRDAFAETSCSSPFGLAIRYILHHYPSSVHSSDLQLARNAGLRAGWTPLLPDEALLGNVIKRLVQEIFPPSLATFLKSFCIYSILAIELLLILHGDADVVKTVFEENLSTLLMHVSVQSERLRHATLPRGLNLIPQLCGKVWTRLHAVNAVVLEFPKTVEALCSLGHFMKSNRQESYGLWMKALWSYVAYDASSRSSTLARQCCIEAGKSNIDLSSMRPKQSKGLCLLKKAKFSRKRGHRVGSLFNGFGTTQFNNTTRRSKGRVNKKRLCEV